MPPYKRKMRPYTSRTSKRRKTAPRRRRTRAMIPYGGRRELKYDLQGISSGGSGSSANIYLGVPLITPLGLLAQGDDNTTRDGRVVTLKSTEFKFALQGDSGTVTRVMVVIDKRPNSGSIWTPGDMMQAGGAIAQQHFDPDKRERWTVLKDVSFVHGAAGSPTEMYLGNFKIRYRGNGLKMRYTGTTAAIGSVDTNLAYLVIANTGGTGAGANEPSGGTTDSVITRFTDN